MGTYFLALFIDSLIINIYIDGTYILSYVDITVEESSYLLINLLFSPFYFCRIRIRSETNMDRTKSGSYVYFNFVRIFILSNTLMSYDYGCY